MQCAGVRRTFDSFFSHLVQTILGRDPQVSKMGSAAPAQTRVPKPRVHERNGKLAVHFHSQPLFKGLSSAQVGSSRSRHLSRSEMVFVCVCKVGRLLQGSQWL